MAWKSKDAGSSASRGPSRSSPPGAAGTCDSRPSRPLSRPRLAVGQTGTFSRGGGSGLTWSLCSAVVPLGEDGLGSHEHQVVVQSHWTIAGPSRDCGAGDTDPHLPQCVTMSKSHCVRAPSSRKMKKMRHRE